MGECCGFDALAFHGRCDVPSALVFAPGQEPRLIEVRLAEAWKAGGTRGLLRRVAEQPRIYRKIIDAARRSRRRRRRYK